MSDRTERDLRAYHLLRHLRVIHGREVLPGTPSRRHLSEDLHHELHEEGFTAHDEKDI